jgi:hypothetical protein
MRIIERPWDKSEPRPDHFGLTRDEKFAMADFIASRCSEFFIAS